MTKLDFTVADTLSQAHAALLEDLARLEGTVQPTSRERISDLRARLGAAERHISEHFRLEEQNGYMDVVRKREPRLERAIQELADEHRELADELDGLIVYAATARRVGAAFRAQVRAWVEHVRKHEARENDLVQDAFTLDMGAED